MDGKSVLWVSRGDLSSLNWKDNGATMEITMCLAPAQRENSCGRTWEIVHRSTLSWDCICKSDRKSYGDHLQVWLKKYKGALIKKRSRAKLTWGGWSANQEEFSSRLKKQPSKANTELLLIPITHNSLLVEDEIPPDPREQHNNLWALNFCIRKQSNSIWE